MGSKCGARAESKSILLCSSLQLCWRWMSALCWHRGRGCMSITCDGDLRPSHHRLVWLHDQQPSVQSCRLQALLRLGAGRAASAATVGEAAAAKKVESLRRSEALLFRCARAAEAWHGLRV